MDKHAADYYHAVGDDENHGHFLDVIPLHLEKQRSWQELAALDPHLPRGWYELAHLKNSDRIEFTRDYWVSRLPFDPNAIEMIQKFFDNLDDIGIFLVQRNGGTDYETHMVYSIRGDSGFFWGRPPVIADAWNEVTRYFGEVILPADYAAFMQIHDGFGKQMDTGIICTRHIRRTYETLLMSIEQGEPLRTAWGDLVDPKTLIPFYESFALRCYQCFWTEWYPGTEMGNVYYSGIERSITLRRPDETGAHVISFPTFLDWLAFYVEAVT